MAKVIIGGQTLCLLLTPAGDAGGLLAVRRSRPVRIRCARLRRLAAGARARGGSPTAAARRDPERCVLRPATSPMRMAHDVTSVCSSRRRCSAAARARGATSRRRQAGRRRASALLDDVPNIAADPQGSVEQQRSDRRVSTREQRQLRHCSAEYAMPARRSRSRRASRWRWRTTPACACRRLNPIAATAEVREALLAFRSAALRRHRQRAHERSQVVRSAASPTADAAINSSGAEHLQHVVDWNAGAAQDAAHRRRADRRVDEHTRFNRTRPSSIWSSRLHHPLSLTPQPAAAARLRLALRAVGGRRGADRRGAGVSTSTEPQVATTGRERRARLLGLRAGDRDGARRGAGPRSGQGAAAPERGPLQGRRPAAHRGARVRGRSGAPRGGSGARRRRPQRIARDNLRALVNARQNDSDQR